VDFEDARSFGANVVNCGAREELDKGGVNSDTDLGKPKRSRLFKSETVLFPG